MAYTELLQVGSAHNKPIRTFWTNDENDIANLPTNIPAGSICECQIAPAQGQTKSTLKVYMLCKTNDNADNGTWYEI